MVCPIGSRHPLRRRQLLQLLRVERWSPERWLLGRWAGGGRTGPSAQAAGPRGSARGKPQRNRLRRGGEDRGWALPSRYLLIP
ncbi:Thyroid Receptor-Interacting Protein 11 [Manis pentadactyla]|nr:Thyroid Receptor-Interacting Protein 11 [Manis pentadactyla]